MPHVQPTACPCCTCQEGDRNQAGGGGGGGEGWWGGYMQGTPHIKVFLALSDVQSGLSSGADCVIQSSHKTLSALTQAAMLHVQGERMDAARISQSLQLLQVSCQSFPGLPG